MIKKYILILLLGTYLLNATASNEDKVKDVFIEIAEKTKNKELITEANNLKFELKKEYKALAKSKMGDRQYSYMGKICERYEIEYSLCLEKFIEEIENGNDYPEFRIQKLEIKNHTKEREYIESLYTRFLGSIQAKLNISAKIFTPIRNNTKITGLTISKLAISL